MWRQQPNTDQLAALIEEGQAASALLESPFFLRVVNDLTNMHTARLLASPVGPAGVAEREANHALQVALTEIVQELMARKASGEQAAEALEEDPYDNRD